MSGPLDGVLVVSLEQAVAAPYCSSRLADAGARVIKVERAEGDFARQYDAAVGEQLSSYFVWLNRGKQSLTADIKQPADVRLIHAIISRADVFIQNLAPGAAERAGFGSESLAARYPSLITLDISGYGAAPEYAGRKAYDLLVQAESGLAMITGHPTGPGRVGVSVCDIACGMTAYAAVLEALLERRRSGRGQRLSASLFDSIADWMSVPLLQYAATGKTPDRVGLAHPSICPYGCFVTRDGSQILIAIQNEREWRDFCRHFMDAPQLGMREGFESNIRRVANRPTVDSHIAARFAQLSRKQAMTLLQAGGTAFGFVNDLAALARHPALRTVQLQTPSGPATVAAPAVTSNRAMSALGPVPALGEHSAAIRSEFLGHS